MIERDKNQNQPITTPLSTTEDEKSGQFENTLRPRALKDFVGQKGIKNNLDIAIRAALKRNEPLDHTLFHGPPGLGKTTLANILSREMGVAIKTTSGPALEKQGDLAAIVTNLKDHDILFIDEIHRLRPAVEEILYSAMEDFAIDIILGKGPSARSMRLGLPRFTLIGATTKLSSLSSPLRDRFGNVFKLQHYLQEEIESILERAAKILNCRLGDKVAGRIAECSRRTPRVSNRLLRRLRDYAEINGTSGEITYELATMGLKELGIDSLGLEETDRQIIRTMIDKFHGGPVGLNTISAAVAEEEATIEDVHEPFLIQLGLLERTARGRMVTRKAFKHLGINHVSDD